MEQTLTQSTQGLLRRLNQAGQPESVSTSSAENELELAPETDTEASTPAENATLEDAGQQAAAFAHEAEDLASYFKALGLINNGKTEPTSPTDADTAPEADTSDAHTESAGPAEIPDIEAVVSANEEEATISAPAIDVSVADISAEQWTDSSSLPDDMPPEQLNEEQAEEETLVPPVSAVDFNASEQPLNFSADEDFNNSSEFVSTLDFLDALADENENTDAGEDTESEHLLRAAHMPPEPEADSMPDVDIAPDTYMDEAPSAVPDNEEPFFEPEEAFPAAASEKDEADPEGSSMDAGTGVVTVHFDENRSDNLHYAADTLQCTVDDLVITAVDWYLDAVLNPDEEDVA